MDIRWFIRILKRKIDDLEKQDIIHSRGGGKWES